MIVLLHVGCCVDVGDNVPSDEVAVQASPAPRQRHRSDPQKLANGQTNHIGTHVALFRIAILS